MDSIRDAIKLAALQENSQESNALRSLLLGLCQQCSVSLQKANSYQELILDELDARHGNTAYLEKVQKELSSMTIAECEKYIAEGQFAPGSMLPKVEAAVKFVESKPGRITIITSLDKAVEALEGKAGTTIA